MNQHVQPFSRSRSKGYPVYVEMPSPLAEIIAHDRARFLRLAKERDNKDLQTIKNF